MYHIRALQTPEDARKAEEERKKQEAEERKKRQMAQLDELKAKVKTLEELLKKYENCQLMIEMGGIEMGTMVYEQAKSVVDAEEYDMAADVMTFVDEIIPQIQSNAPLCDQEAATAPPAGTTPPAEGTTPPAEGTTTPPAEGTTPPPTEPAPAGAGQ
jgi:anion-transporting  ArsA/GET3 family ATPase